MRFDRFAAATLCGLVFAGSLAVETRPADAADLFRYHRHHRVRGADIFRDDYACPLQEPAIYRPRIANFHEPLCYAARPYGISTHLYDISSELLHGRDADYGTGY